MFLDRDITDDPLSAYLGGLAAQAAAEGARGIGSLVVTQIEHGDFEARSVAVIEWASTEAFAACHSRPTWPSASLAGRNAVPVTVDEDRQITLRPDGRYEFGAFWMNRTNAALNGPYSSTSTKETRP